MIFPRKSRMPVQVQERLLEHFVAGTTARAAAKLVGVQERTAVVFFQRLRQLVASKQEGFLLSGEIESDESYVEGGRKGRHAQVPVFGLLMRGNRVCTAIIPYAKAKPFIHTIQESVTPDSIVYTNSSQASEVLNPFELHHKCIKPSKTVLSRRGYHVNGIENFWNESKRYLRRFYRIPKTSLGWYLKECEWRFNQPDHHALSKQLKDWYQSELNKA
jgi:transposase